MVDVTRLRALREAATPGPWRVTPARTGPRGGLHPAFIDAPRNGWVNGITFVTIGDSTNDDATAVAQMSADAALIVEAVNALPALLAEIEALRRVRDAAAADMAEKCPGEACGRPTCDALRDALRDSGTEEHS